MTHCGHTEHFTRDGKRIGYASWRGYEPCTCQHGANYGLPNGQRRCVECGVDFDPSSALSVTVSLDQDRRSGK